MAESIKTWRSLPPPPFLLEQAVADPLRHLSLSAWLPLHSLRRGAQFGKTDYRSVWCIGLYRLPSDWVLGTRNDRRRTRVGPLAFINPIAMRLLIQSDGRSRVHKVGEALAQRDLLIPSHRNCLTWPAKIPGSEALSPMYALRGEVGFIEGDAPAGLLAIAKVIRAALAGYYAQHPVTELRPDPSYRFEFPTFRNKPGSRPQRRRGLAPTKREIAAAIKAATPSPQLALL
jgi:hypothetical protein